jgi:hypothetical protein
VRFDELIGRKPQWIALLYTQVMPWRDFSVGNKLQIGCMASAKSAPKWRNRTVVVVFEKPAATGERLERWISISYNGKTAQRRVDDGLLCRPGDHTTFEN